MQTGRITTLSILVIFLTGWSAVGRETQSGRTCCCAGQLAEIEQQLELTDDQASALQHIVAGRQEDRDAIFTDHGLERGDLLALQQKMSSFSRQVRARLATVMDQEQLQILHQEIVENGPLEFMQLPKDEKVARLQDFLGLSEEEGGQVAAILEEGRAQRRKLLQASAVNPAHLLSLRRDMAAFRAELQKSVREILSPEQMEQFEERRRRIPLRECGYGLVFTGQGGQL